MNVVSATPGAKATRLTSGKDPERALEGAFLFSCCSVPGELHRVFVRFGFAKENVS
jgi:hypothetical protein